MTFRQCRLSLFLVFVVSTGAHAQGLILPRPLPNLPPPPAGLFPFPAHVEKEVQLTYSQVVPFTAGIYEYRYPMAKNADGSLPVETVIGATIRSPQPIKAVYSPSHNVAVSRPDEHTARV